MEWLDPLIKCIVALFVIMDPFASLPTFLMLTKKQTDEQRFKSALTAAGVAGAALVIFTLIGPWLMNMLSISMPAFQIAGGILLLVTALQFFLGLELGDTDPRKVKSINVAVVVVGVPLLTGPGVMTTAVLLANQYGVPIVFVAATAVVIITLLVLMAGGKLHKFIGEQGLAVFSKLMAIMLAAIAVEFIMTGLRLYILGSGLLKTV